MKNRGFTLIELLVVISIISLLSSIVLASLQQARSKARDSQRVQALIQIRNALELAHSRDGRYPLDPNVPSSSDLANMDTGLSCWQCGGSMYSQRDAGALSDKINSYLKNRPCDPFLPNNNPSGGCSAQFTDPPYQNVSTRGFFYKVDQNGTAYKITLARTIEKIDNAPQVMHDSNFINNTTPPNPSILNNTNDATISLYSSEVSKNWTINCTFGVGGTC